MTDPLPETPKEVMPNRSAQKSCRRDSAPPQPAPSPAGAMERAPDDLAQDGERGGTLGAVQGTPICDRETVQTLLDLLNPLHGELDRQTYDQKHRENFDVPPDVEYNVDITARMERDLTQAVCILESRLRSAPPVTEEMVERAYTRFFSYAGRDDVGDKEAMRAALTAALRHDSDSSDK